MKGAKIVVEALLNEGVDTIFGYPGGYVIDLFDELYQVSDRLKLVLTCHEQGASHAADGYARSTGRVGVVMATSGPGATNLVTGIATAYMDSVPLIAITGNVPLNQLGRDSFQEVDIAGVTLPVTKHNYIVKSVDELVPIISEAFRLAQNGRPGPVLIDIPKNIQQADGNYYVPSYKPAVIKTPETNQLAKAANIINNSKKPLLYIGGGIIISGASAEVKAVSDKLDCPVASSMMGLGAFPASDPMYLGMIGMHGNAPVPFAVMESDCIIAVGCRFSDRVAGDRKRFGEGKRIIHIDIDCAEIDKNVNADAFIHADAKASLSALFPLLSDTKRPEWRAYIEKIRAEKRVKESIHKLNPRGILRSIDRQSGPDHIVATDVGQHQMWTAQTIRFEKPRTFLTSGGLGTMGFGMGASIGAAMATGKQIILITGDGSFHMNFNEVVTAVANKLNIVIFVFNNNTLGMVHQWQKMFYSARYSSTTLNRPTDYKLLAKAFGAGYFELDDNKDIDKVVEKALSYSGTAIVNCKIFIDENVFPMIPPGKNTDSVILDKED